MGGRSAGSFFLSRILKVEKEGIWEGGRQVFMVGTRVTDVEVNRVPIDSRPPCTCFLDWIVPCFCCLLNIPRLTSTTFNGLTHGLFRFLSHGNALWLRFGAHITIWVTSSACCDWDLCWRPWRRWLALLQVHCNSEKSEGRGRRL